eukprot:4597494-Alexandrium_andersonii.AAC.1
MLLPPLHLRLRRPLRPSRRRPRALAARRAGRVAASRAGRAPTKVSPTEGEPEASRPERDGR